MLTDAIKQQILSLAIQGKLTDQRPEDGTAEELYRSILAEKKRFIKAGKLKKEKPLPPIEEKDIPFDIPKNWKWVRLGEITLIERGGSPRPIKSYLTNSSDGINWIKIGDSDKDGKYICSTAEKIKPEAVTKSRRVNKGDLLLTNSMSYGRPYILKTDGCIHDGWLVVSQYLTVFVQDFLYYLLLSGCARTQFAQKAQGAVVKNLNIEKVSAAIFPLPPLPEQERIVEKLEAIMTALQDLETAQQRAQSIKLELRKSLLQEAIQGKLTDQRPEDGSAEELYRAILAEKKRLIKAGKLKKEKPLPPLEEKDIPFDIPENWKWVRLGEVGSFERGSGIKKTETVQEGLPCVRYGQLYTTFRTRFTEAVSYIPRPLFDVCKKAKCGDILMSLTGENNFDIALAVAYEGKDPLAIGGDMTRYTPCSVVPMYLVTVLNSGHGISCKSKLATGDIIVHISNDKLASIPIPLPPPAEQERIVAKLEELLPLCD